MADRIIKSPDTERKDRVPPGQRLVSKMPVLQFDGIPATDLAHWKFRMFGLVEAEQSLDWKQFSALPRTRLFCDLHCVTGWSMLNTNWEGIAVAELKNLVKIKPEAKFALVHSADGYSTNLALAELFAPDALFALTLEGQPLPPQYGGPLRLLVPRLYLWKSAKWATGVEFISQNQRGYWEARGYHIHGDPWTEERYSRDEKE